MSDAFDELQRPMPTGPMPEGSIIGEMDASTNHPEGPELLHRPHAFALMHGEDGAKVAFGQLLWRIDQINIYYGLNAVDGTLLADDIDTADGSSSTNAAHNHGRSGQNVVAGLNAKVPTIDTEDGEPFTAGINFNEQDKKYHQLDGHGDVYLYWKVDLDDADSKVTKCWVTVDGTTAQADIPAVAIGHSPLDRQTTGDGTNDEGTYRVKLGSVNEDAQVTQDISSDVHWSIFLLGRVSETGS